MTDERRAAHDRTRDAARLVQWGLRVRARPAQEPDYRRLVDLYHDDPAFRATARAIADGLGLRIVDVGEYGAIVAPLDDSVFALRGAEFRPTSSTVEDRLLDGVIQLAIAATVFPTPRDLEDDPAIARPPVTVSEIEDSLRALCERLAEQARDQPDPVAGPDGHDGFEEAWRVYHRRLGALETRDGSSARRSTRRLIETNLERLRDHGGFTRDTRGDEASYQPTYRYQALVRELAANEALRRVRDVLAQRGS
jgi:hypothetical protein